MANQKHLDLLKQGVGAWNEWRREHPNTKLDLSGADLRGADLQKTNFTGTDLQKTNFTGADLRGADLRGADLSTSYLVRADLEDADLRGAILKDKYLRGVDFREANLSHTDLSGANLQGTNLSGANLQGTNLSGANLQGANLIRASLVETNLSEANLTGCLIYGISAWNVQLKDAIQLSLIITLPSEPTITVDNLEVAQFIYLLLNNERIRYVIDTISKKAVLILGRFTPKRKAVLDALRNELRKQDYLPILFDFEKPASRDLTETVST